MSSDPSISELAAEIRALRSVVERSLRSLWSVDSGGARLLSLRQVAKIYRVRESTVRDDYRSGMLGRGRQRGRGIYVSAKRAAEHYGA